MDDIYHDSIEKINTNIDHVNLFELKNILSKKYMSYIANIYENSIEKISDSQKKNICEIHYLYYILTYGKLLDIIQFFDKYLNIELKSKHLYNVTKNSDINVVKYLCSVVKNINKQDVIDACIINPDISLETLKIVMNQISNLSEDYYTLQDYLQIMKCFGSNNNLENFKYIYSIYNECLLKYNLENDLTQKIILREQPTCHKMDYRDYTIEYEGDLLLLVSDSNSYEVLEYLLKLNIFSKESIKKSYEYVKQNPYHMRFQNNKRVENKNKVKLILEKYFLNIN